MPKFGPTQEELNRLFCTLLRTTREDAGLRQVDMAKALGRPQSYVSKYESGERRIDFIMLRQICMVCGLTTKDFAVRFEKLAARK